MVAGGDRSAGTATNVAGTTSIVTATVITSGGVTDGGVTAATAIATAATAAAATTAAATATALSFSTVAFSIPVAMHLSRYGRLPSWNKSRTQCLVIFHSTMKEILATAICCNLFLCYCL